jgi:hypothetical protein
MISKKLFTTIMMVGATLMSVTTHAQKVTTSTEITQLQVNEDNAGTRVIKYSADGHQYRIVMNEDKISGIYVDGAKLSASQYAEYEPTVKKIIARIETDLRQAALDRELADKHRAEADVHRQQAMKHRESAEEQRLKTQQLEKEAEEHQRHIEKTIVENKEHAIQAQRMAELQHTAADVARQQAQVHHSQADESRKRAQAHRLQAAHDRTQAEVHKAKGEKDKQLLDDMMNEAVSDGLTNSKESLTSLVLDAETLTVNGIKQSSAVHAKYKSKYLKNAGKKISFKRSGTSTTILMD